VGGLGGPRHQNPPSTKNTCELPEAVRSQVEQRPEELK
jgi:hypothetical protein